MFPLRSCSADKRKAQLLIQFTAAFNECSFVIEQMTYTLMYVLPDADKSVGQSTGVALILWLRGGVVAEHSLNVETQHKTHETARLTILIETRRGQITTNTHIIILHTCILLTKP